MNKSQPLISASSKERINTLGPLPKKERKLIPLSLISEEVIPEQN
jgi:hypothetical protein